MHTHAHIIHFFILRYILIRLYCHQLHAQPLTYAMLLSPDLVNTKPTKHSKECPTEMQTKT